LSEIRATMDTVPPLAAPFHEMTEALSRRFESVTEEVALGGWRARCPLCPPGAAPLFLARDMSFSACPAGHARADILARVDQVREPGVDDGEKPPPLPLTDTGNAERLVRRHGNFLRFCHPWREWLVWDGRRWKRDATAEVMRRSKETVRALYVEASEIEHDKLRGETVSWAKKSETRDKRRAMVDLASSELGIPVLPEELDADPWLFNVENGTVDLRTGAIHKHRRSDLISKLSPVRYDRTAACPTWDKFLLEVMDRDQELVTFLQRACGYALTGDVSAHVLFFGHGSGRNGKSTTLSTLLAVLGEYGKAAAPDLLLAKKNDQIPVDQADLFGCRLAICQEVEDGRRFAEVTLKQLTGGDRVKARFMRENFFEFDPTHKIFLAANHKPRVRGTDEGIWSRIMLIPFSVTIPKERRDPQLKEKLEAELPGILAWAVRGTLDWLAAGGGLQGLAAPSKVLAATEEYREEEDQVGNWVKDCCIESPTGVTTARGAYDSFTAWCERNSDRPLGKKSFGERLFIRGYKPEKGTAGVRIWVGFILDPAESHVKPSGASGATDPQNEVDGSLFPRDRN
jgi:putative DNA primase/helicase